ncbi:MAG: uracil-DNA glycosylase [Chloroflexi bacterium]|jgi:DNA polymerase|nr:uracil-DNA glycosylase [Chloroflexota bacterium]
MSALTELYKEIADCRDCELVKHRTKVVPGEGPEDAELLFVGEAPGWHEDQQGRPFVGPAGQFLDQLLALIGQKREQVYIANVIKCRPPQNRDPLPREIEACRTWLDRQIEIIRPKVIVTLGRYSLARYFPNEGISKVHGKARKVGDFVCYPMYHPAAALHQNSLRQIIEADMLQIPRVLDQLAKGAEVPAESQQLSLF